MIALPALVLLAALAAAGADDRPTAQSLPIPPVPSKAMPGFVLEPTAGTRDLGAPAVALPDLGRIWLANQALLAAQNRERLRRGLAPLAIDWRLAAAACDQAADCARRDRLTHAGSDGSTVSERVNRKGYRWSALAENAAAQDPPPSGWPGDPRTPEWAVEGWMQSPGHRANLLGPYPQFGAGFCDAPDGTRYWVVAFGRP